VEKVAQISGQLLYCSKCSCLKYKNNMYVLNTNKLKLAQSGINVMIFQIISPKIGEKWRFLLNLLPVFAEI
jgi:hypothetical protein